MNRQKIFEKLTEVFTDIFDGDITLTDATTAADVEGWDSLNHITLLTEVADTFHFRFSTKEQYNMKNVGEMVDIIEKKGTLDD